MTTYEKALEKSSRVGASKCQGPALIAMTCETLGRAHPGLSPKLLYDGAIKSRLTSAQLLKMSEENPASLGDLMFF